MPLEDEKKNIFLRIIFNREFLVRIFLWILFIAVFSYLDSVLKTLDFITGKENTFTFFSNDNIKNILNASNILIITSTISIFYFYDNDDKCSFKYSIITLSAIIAGFTVWFIFNLDSRNNCFAKKWTIFIFLYTIFISFADKTISELEKFEERKKLKDINNERKRREKENSNYDKIFDNI